jgi:hypothetical protein
VETWRRPRFQFARPAAAVVVVVVVLSEYVKDEDAFAEGRGF